MSKSLPLTLATVPSSRKLMKYVAFKSIQFLKPRFGSPIAEFYSRWVFFFLFSGAMQGVSLARPLPPRVAGQGWRPHAPRPPPSLSRALVFRCRLSAAMGSEMEPLLLAWSYFRRRKFQLCADLCTQMLEKSPYDQVQAGPRQTCGSRQ